MRLLVWTLLPLLAVTLAAPALALRVSVAKAQYAVGEPVVVRITNVTSPQDWVTVVPVGTPADEYGSWDWVEAAGSLTFSGLEAGAYEARAYCCWAPGSAGHGGYRVVSRAAFRVGAGGGGSGQRVALEVPARVRAGQGFRVGYSAVPAYETDWIALTPAGEPDDTYGQWDYTGGYTDGIASFDGVAAGRYEVRFYCCWSESSSYAVVARRTVVVE